MSSLQDASNLEKPDSLPKVLQIAESDYPLGSTKETLLAHPASRLPITQQFFRSGTSRANESPKNDYVLSDLFGHAHWRQRKGRSYK